MERRLPYAAKRTEDFLRAALESGAHITLMHEASIKPRLRWALDALALYYGNETTFSEVGRALTPPTTHETARKIVGEGMSALWRASSDDVKKDYPFDSVPISKPLKGSSRLRILGNNTRTIVESSMRGATYQEIEHMGNDAIARARKVMKDSGVNVPYKNFSAEEYARIIEVASNENLPRKEYEQITGRLTRSVVMHIASTTGAFVSLIDAAADAGFFIGPATSSVARKIIEEKGLSLTFERQIQSGKNKGQKQRYTYVAQRDLGLVAETFYNCPEMDKYRESLVSQIAGPDTDLHVSTTDIHGNPDFSSLNNLLLKHRLTVAGRGPKVPYSELLEGCPAPIFMYKKRAFFPARYAGFLDRFLRERREILGL